MNVEHLTGKKRFTIGSSRIGERLDLFLAKRIDISRSQIKNLIDDQKVLVNQDAVKAGYKLKLDDQVDVSIPKPSSIDLQPQPLDIEIVYQDVDLIVINKPAGLVVHPGAGHWEGTLVNALLYYCNDLSGIGGKLRPGIVHRLDKDTTGLLVAAKNDKAHQYLATQIKAKTVKRYYLALVHGMIKDDMGTIKARIGRHPNDRKRMAVTDNGRTAVTDFIVKERLGNRYTLVECRLRTGRTHQIRVHLAAINHPIIGDPIYGRKGNNLGSKRQLLHAYHLGFEHPRQEWMEFSSDIPPDFSLILDKARNSS